MKSIFKSSFYRRIQSSLFIFILLPLSLSTIFSYILIKDVVIKKAEDSSQNIVNIIANDLNKNVEDITYASNLFSNSDSFIFEELREIKDVVELSSFEEYQRYNQISDYLNLTYSKTSGLGAQVFFINKENLAIYGSSDVFAKESLEEVAQLQWLDGLKPHQIYWTNAIRLKSIKSSDESLYYFAVRIINENFQQERIGAIFIGIPYKYFETLFSESEDGHFLLYDDQDKLIFSHAQNGETTIQDDYIEVSANVLNTGWSVIYRSSVSNITAEISKMFSFYAIIVSISILIFLILSIFISRSLYRPLNELKNVAEQFGNENLNVRFPVKGTDEIAILGNAFNDMLDQIKRLFTRVQEKQEEKRIIELEALFAQIHPHFLINTLNSIKYNLILDGAEVHGEKINSLMRLLRAYMRIDELAYLHQECNLLIDYNEIMQLRSDRTIHLIIDLPKELEKFRIPRLILQPIVENAIVHGFEEDSIDPTIHVQVKDYKGEVVIKIEDNGLGMSAIKLEEVQNSLHERIEDDEREKHIGLRNVSQRLKLTYGTDVLLNIYINDQSGVTTKIHIPKIDKS